MVQFLSANASGTPSSDAPPAEQTSKAISLQVSKFCQLSHATYNTRFQTGVVFDAPPIGQQFGLVVTDVSSTPYHAGDEVHVQFIGANPRVSS